MVFNSKLIAFCLAALSAASLSTAESTGSRTCVEAPGLPAKYFSTWPLARTRESTPTRHVFQVDPSKFPPGTIIPPPGNIDYSLKIFTEFDIDPPYYTAFLWQHYLPGKSGESFKFIYTVRWEQDGMDPYTKHWYLTGDAGCQITSEDLNNPFTIPPTATLTLYL